MVGVNPRAGPLAQAPLRRFTPQLAALLLVAAVAWAVTVGSAQGMSSGPSGTAGMGLPSFLIMWTPMMAAMMLPAVAPIAAAYSRTVRTLRTARLTTFALGYLVVWVAAGVPAFLLAWGAERLTQDEPGLATTAAVTAYAVCGVYQLTPWKDRCLQHCRSPLALLLQYGSYKGRLRDFRAGLHHGAYCAGCCWALFVVLVAVGVTNLAAMVILASVVLLEKLWSRGVTFSRAVGVLAVLLAVAVIWFPELAPGLHGEEMTHPTPMNH